MAKQKKATKKFQKKNSGGELQRRKKFKVYKGNQERRANVAGAEGAALRMPLRVLHWSTELRANGNTSQA
jgi:hypothetical protein